MRHPCEQYVAEIKDLEAKLKRKTELYDSMMGMADMRIKDLLSIKEQCRGVVAILEMAFASGDVNRMTLDIHRALETLRAIK